MPEKMQMEIAYAGRESELWYGGYYFANIIHKSILLRFLSYALRCSVTEGFSINEQVT